MNSTTTERRLGLLDGYALRADIARDLGITTRTLARWSDEPDGLPMLLLGGKAYHPIDATREFLERRVRRPNPSRVRKGRRA